MKKKKILILGSARHGKDTVAEIIESNTGLKFSSSSMACSELFIFDTLKEKYGYKTAKECFDDRVNHRGEWHNLIKDYNKEDKSKLAKLILTENDIYVGMREVGELNTCIEDGVFDLIIGVFDPRKDIESVSSFNIDIFEKCSFVICNNGSLEELESNVKLICNIL